MVRNLKITLAYDGADFNGWQVQPGLPTVQGALAEGLLRVTGESVLPQGSGRTDAGVHALAQVASAAVASPIPLDKLAIALNHVLPAAIRVLQVEEVPPEFHARVSARGKTYRYRILRAPVCSPFLARYVYHHPWPLDEAAMAQAAELVVGSHDFTSFAAVDPERTMGGRPSKGDEKRRRGHPDAEPERSEGEAEGPAFFVHPRQHVGTGAGDLSKPGSPASPVLACWGGMERTRLGAPSPQSLARGIETGIPNPEFLPHPPEHAGTAKVSLSSNVRTIFRSEFCRQGDELIYEVCGSGFLQHMVRNLVGTFLLVGKGTLTPARVPVILAVCNRSANPGATAPARGLYLIEVQY